MFLVVLGLATLLGMPSTVVGAVAKGVFAADSGEVTVTVRRATPALKTKRTAAADTLVFKYTFPAPVFEDCGDGTTTVRMNGVENFGDVGDPLLPALPVRLAIPKGRELLSVGCDGEFVPCAAGVVLSHVHKPIPISSTETDATERNEAVYGSDEPFPERCFSEPHLAGKRGVTFVDFLLTPVKYKGLSGEVSYYPEITVTLSLEPEGADPATRQRRAADDAGAPGVRFREDTDSVLLLVDNPEEVESYVPAQTSGSTAAKGESTQARTSAYASKAYVQPTLPCKVDSDFPNGYQHVIITSETLLDAFEQLVTYRRGQGISSTAVTVEQIKKNYSGKDTQEKIRNFIKDAYQTWNTGYIVLGGDTGHVPTRYLYCDINEDVNTIPSDLYYQCLDGNFNADGDSVFGETNDGVDWYAEVAIGRVPAENSTEANNWLSKLKQYNADAQSGKSYTKAMLSAGEDLGAQFGSARYASVSLEQIRIGGTYDGYRTKGFDNSASYATRDTLYESATHSWGASDLISKINANKYAVINHLGHGSVNGVMQLSSSAVDKQLSNTSPLFVYSQACDSGAFDKDCVAEHLVTSSKYGCFGGVWNARYGLGGGYNITDGASQKFARQFWDAAFTPSDTKNGTIGLANQLSHERNASYADSKSYNRERWVLYETNLFGDPIQQIDGVTQSGEESKVSISKSSVSFSASGGAGSAEVTASSSWTASASDSWISLKTTGGSGNGTISYTVQANTGTSGRSGSITVKSGSATATQRISQSADAAKLGVSPAANDFGCDAGEGMFTVEANYSWTVEKSAGWIKLGTTSGIGNGTVSYSVDANTGSGRTGKITVKSGSLTATHTVSQSKQPTLGVSPESATVSAAAANGSFSVSSDSSWTATTPDAWITLQTTGGKGNGTVGYSVARNAGARRTGTIYVKSGTAQRTFEVNQRCANTVSFSENSVSIPASGGSGTVTATVLADGAGTIEASSSFTGGWITWTRSDASVTDGHRYTYSWTAEENSTGAEREETLDVTLNGTTYSCTFRQDAASGSYRVTYRPGAYGTGDEISIAMSAGGLLILKGAIYTRTGYTQTGWATTDGGPEVYGLKQWYTGGKSIVLYPYWEKNATTYAVTFQRGDYGSGNPQTLQKTAGVALTLPGALFTRSGYEQKGWSTSKTGSPKTYELGGQYTADAAATFYPYWEKSAGEVPDIAFYRYDDSWAMPGFLNTTNTEWGLYAPKTVFEQGESLRLNYCLHNYSKTATVAADSITRYVTLYQSDGTILKYLTENFEKGFSIQPGYNLQFCSANVDGWLSSCSPGNYAIQVHLDPTGRANERNDNWWRTWFVVKAPGVTLKEALDCNTLDFNLAADGLPVSPYLDGIATDGLSVQFGPQDLNANTYLWADVAGPGTLSFKWDAQCEEATNACMVCYVDDEMKAWTWGKPSYWEGEAWENASIEVGEGAHRVWWGFWTYEPDPSWLSVGWLDNVTWTPAREKYAVTYKPGSSGSGLQRTDTKEQGTALELRGAIFTRTGYTQTGWATIDGGAKAYGLRGAYTADSAVTLYPYWTANTYGVSYALDGGTAGASQPTAATYGTAFRVSAPSKAGCKFTGWAVTSGLEPATARYGTSQGNVSTAIGSDGQKCSNGAAADVWFANLTPLQGGSVTLTATWEDDGSRDIAFYAPGNLGWAAPMFLCSTNTEYLAYVPETEFEQFSPVYLNFCAVNWNRAGSAVLQSTRLTITDEAGNVFDEGEPIQRATIDALTYWEFRDMGLRRYLHGIAPGRYKLTAELDPNGLLDDPDRSNNTTSIWFTVTAPADPIPALPADATAADVRAALAGSADGRLADNIGDVSAYSAYRAWAQKVKRADGKLAGAAAVKASDKAWFSFAVDSPTLVEREIVGNDVKIEAFSVSPNGNRLDFTVGIAGVEIGAGATREQLETVFGFEGAASLVDGTFASGTHILESASPENGKVKLTAKPAPPKTSDDSAAPPSFLRVTVKQ